MFNTIREKLLTSYLVIALIFTISGLFSIYHVADMADMTNELVSGQWVTEKLFDNALLEIELITQQILDPDRSGQPPAQLLARAEEKIDEYILLFRTSDLDASVGRDLIPLMLRFKGVLPAPYTMHAEPEQRRAVYNLHLDALIDKAISHGAGSLARQLIESQRLVDSFLLKDDPQLRQQYDRIDEKIRQNPAFPAFAEKYSAVQAEGVHVFQGIEVYRNVVEDFRRTAQELKAGLNHQAQIFDQQAVRPKGRSVNEHFSLVIMIVTGSVLVSILVAVFLGFLFANNLSRPLVQTVRVIEGMERGVMNVRLSTRRKDEVGQVARAIDMFADSLQEALQRLDREVLERKQAEMEAKESEQKYRRLSTEFQTLLEGISDSLILVSPERLVIWANKSTLRQLGGEVESLVGRHLEEIDRLYGFSEQTVCVEETFERGKSSDGTFRGREGKIFGIKTFPLLDPENRVTGVIRLTSDITEGYQLRQAAIETSRLASLGELSAGVAHEINNPNALVLLNMPVIIDVFRDALPLLEQHAARVEGFELAGMRWEEIGEVLPDLMATVLESGFRIQRIVNDLKDFVHPGEGDLFEPIDLNTAVRSATRLLGNTFLRDSAGFRLDLAENLPPVKGHLQQIEQVVLNLMQNAFNAMESSEDELCLRTLFDAERNLCLIEVADTGVGIKPEHLPHLTEPFFTTRRNEGGTGLGLSISTRIIKDHGGQLLFRPNDDRGTVVTIELPAHSEA